jgi:FkbM family methyltransferase
MVDLAYKWQRVRRLSAAVGFTGALSLEAQITLKRPLMRVRHKDLPTPVYLRGRSSDISVFEAVFEQRELDWPHRIAPGHVIDGGANVGLSTLVLAHQFPGATVIAVEPDRDNIRMIEQNTAHLPSVVIEHAGLWTSDCDLVIANPGADDWALQCRPARPDESSATFRGLSMDTLFARHKIERCSLLKLDIEGAELELFADPGDWLGRTDAIVVEVHGEEARDRIFEACPPDAWASTVSGEKLVLTRKSARNRS